MQWGAAKYNPVIIKQKKKDSKLYTKIVKMIIVDINV